MRLWYIVYVLKRDSIVGVAGRLIVFRLEKIL